VRRQPQRACELPPEGNVSSGSDNGSADGAIFTVLAALKDSHYGGLVLAARPGDLARPLARVHVARLAADKRFVGLNVT
jgi:hypothetical protein